MEQIIKDYIEQKTGKSLSQRKLEIVRSCVKCIRTEKPSIKRYGLIRDRDFLEAYIDTNLDKLEKSGWKEKISVMLSIEVCLAILIKEGKL
ncbi:MAG: hypothetical protein J6I84_04330 [Bacilli bacterium]|nr:hypothetical protein [Bacilli bacterium]